MSDPTDKYPPLDPKRVYELPHRGGGRKPATVDILIATVCALLETIGEMTGRETDATVLIKLARESFGG